MRVAAMLATFVFARSAFAYEGGHFAAPEPKAHKPVLTKAPVLLHFEPATYPESQRGRGKVEVILLLTIDAEGHVTRSTPQPAKVPDTSASAPAGGSTPQISSGGSIPQISEFAAAAQAAAAKLTFSPAEVDGKPSPIGFEFRYVFSEDLPAPAPASEPSSIASSEPTVPTGTAVLKGEIREAGTRLKVAGASVRVEIGERVEERITDEQGAFLIDTLPAGTAKITVAALRYRRLTAKVRVDAHVETGVRYYLQREVLDPFETTVRTQKESNEVTRHVISREELRVVPGSVGDPLRVVQDLAAVARRSADHPRLGARRFRSLLERHGAAGALSLLARPGGHPRAHGRRRHLHPR
jgi:hypothetical protein